MINGTWSPAGKTNCLRLEKYQQEEKSQIAILLLTPLYSLQLSLRIRRNKKKTN